MPQPFSIERPVGERETNRSDDLKAVRNALAAHGLCQRTVTGQRNAKFKPDLTAGIRIFQRKAGLHPDGLVIPGGPTAHALALGGNVQARAPAENKLLDDADCAALRDRVLTAAEQVASIADDIQRVEKRRLDLEGELSQIISTLGQLAGRLKLGIDPSPRNLDAVSRELNNLPNDPEVQQAQGKVSEARRKIAEIQTIDSDLAFFREQRNKAEQIFNRWIAQFERDCTAFV